MTETAVSWPPMRPMSEAPRTNVEILASISAECCGTGFVIVRLCNAGKWREDNGDRWTADELAGWWPLPIVGPEQEANNA